MKQRFRLRRRQDFDRVIGAERLFAGRAVVAFAHPSRDGRWRVGVTVSRRLRGSVRRNRLRRRLREAAKSALLPPEQGAGSPQASGPSHAPGQGGYDVVLIGRPAALEMPWSALQEETARVRSRLVGASR